MSAIYGEHILTSRVGALETDDDLQKQKYDCGKLRGT
jgi:hypothetical protein